MKETMPYEQEYHAELVRLKEALKTVTSTVDIRGSGYGQFVVAERSGMTVEISKSEQGIWIEYWNQGDETPVHEATFSSYGQAIEDAIKWLTTEE